MVIESCVGNWKKTAWKRLDVEEIEQQCKKFSKDIRMLGKLVRTWEPFVYIERLLKNLVTSLRAITELQNSAIKDRHWLELMKSTGVSQHIHSRNRRRHARTNIAHTCQLNKTNFFVIFSFLRNSE